MPVGVALSWATAIVAAALLTLALCRWLWGHAGMLPSGWSLRVIGALRHKPARALVDGIFEAVQECRGDTPANDDMTAVVVRITT